ncbi:MAG: NAD(P)(+) transhydrogenase (Re/Si-specific) subunit beta [Bacteroidota bacterium]
MTAVLNFAYLIGALFFVVGLRRLSSPDTARRGNMLAAVGMGLAIIATFFVPLARGHNNYLWIVGGIALGGIVGLIAARRIQMTSMPQMVSIFNGLGGACALVLAMVELNNYYSQSVTWTGGQLVIVLLALLIGGVSFTGSLLAFGKLEGLVNDRKITFNGHNILNMVLLIATLAASVYLYSQGVVGGMGLGIAVMILSLIYGFSFVAPIGGADMPVVISLLNSFTGLSAAAAGLIYDSQIMLVGGILVGASGTILTVLMCQAMNRSLLNVLVGNFGGGGGAAKAQDGDQVAKEVTITDAAIQLFYAQSVIFVPGYGLAVAQAQKICKELDDLLESNGVSVRYAIHPVAGRMPGHMNVLLAEADVPYPKLIDLDEANDALPSTDMVVVVGANDVVNPSALDDSSSPIYGMPVLNVWEAKNVIILKRSMRPGYAGIQNPLFFHERSRMLFGDAKASIQKLVNEVKSL